MANQTIPGLSSTTSPSTATMLWINDPNASPQDRSIKVNLLLSFIGIVSSWVSVLTTAFSSLVAPNATHATNADNATNATNATHATNADSATNATTASACSGNSATAFGRTLANLAQALSGALHFGASGQQVLSDSVVSQISVSLLGGAGTTAAIPVGSGYLAPSSMINNPMNLQFYNGSSWTNMCWFSANAYYGTITLIGSTGSNYRLLNAGSNGQQFYWIPMV